MNIGLIDVDGHAKVKKWGATVYPNLALCKIAAYHRAKGDHVEWATMFTHYDILYVARIFNFSEDDQFVYDADRVIRGGTGYDVTSKLPEEIDRTQPDYSIYPAVPSDVAYGFLTRGCPNRCHWCVVPRKEGDIRPYMDVDDIATPARRKLVLMDNNILAAGDYCTEQLQKIILRGYSVDFNQALDARLVNEQNASLLAKIRWTENRIRFGCDTTAQIAECERAIPHQLLRLSWRILPLHDATRHLRRMLPPHQPLVVASPGEPRATLRRRCLPLRPTISRPLAPQRAAHVAARHGPVG